MCRHFGTGLHKTDLGRDHSLINHARLSKTVLRIPSPPQTLEAPACGSRVVDGVPGVAVAEVVLDEVEVVALVGQREAAGVPQRVRVNVRQACPPGRGADEIVDRLPGERLASLGDEQPGQRESPTLPFRLPPS